MASLSHRQFRDYIRANDGGSRSLETGELGPESGTYAARSGTERIGYGKIHTGKIARHADSLAGRRGYQGGWVDRDAPGNPLYLDHSRRTLSTALGVSLGEIHNQVSVYAPQHPLGPVIRMGSPEAEAVKQAAIGKVKR